MQSGAYAIVAKGFYTQISLFSIGDYKMEIRRLKSLDAIAGWIVFAISAVVYLLTIGPSASLWDCGEFVVCIHKLEVGHPPGAPFFMLLYNFFSHMTSDPQKIAYLCNAVSGLVSAGTIYFLFRSITHIARKLLVEEGALQVSRHQAVCILAAGTCGALVYTFSDTFWYSAVEAEVYALSSLFTAVVFWLMLKWEEKADSPISARWLILIAYLMGLGIGVHLLNLLCIPAMALIFYYRKYSKPTTWGTILALLVSFVVIILIMFGVIQGSMKVATRFDVFAVNVLGLSFNSGMIIYLVLMGIVMGLTLWLLYSGKNETFARLGVLLTACLMGIPFISSSWLLWFVILAVLSWLFFSKKNLVSMGFLSTLQSALVAMAIGFSCYGVILIRSAAQPPMNENDPSTPITLKGYLNREQYGSVPLISGPSFASQPVAIKEAQHEWKPAPKDEITAKDRYIKVAKPAEYEYSHKTFFPRMYSPRAEHIRIYNTWVGRHPEDMSEPTFGENLRFFFSYQINFMYWRYFGWNFIGRQNDLYSSGSMLKGGVATGFNFIDRFQWGDKEYYPDEMTPNKGHNVYYLMPLILGLLGIAFQIAKKKRGIQSFLIVFFLFFMTGLAIILYINQTPLQPRERDYAYAGSFYAFAIWVGLGAAAVGDFIMRLKVKKVPASVLNLLGGVTAIHLAVLVPVQMAIQNWDDHDRSGRTVARDLGANYLNSCGDQAILFCFGDNDTFPVWYAQEIEGIRTDVRACNLSYLQAEWYVDQMRCDAYESKALPIRWLKPSFYYPKAYARIESRGEMTVEQAYRMMLEDKGNPSIFPTDHVLIPLDKAAVGKAFPGLACESDNMLLTLQDGGALVRDGMVALDVIANNNWERPIYWLKSTPTNLFSNLNNYLSSSGMAFRLLPQEVAHNPSYANTEAEYDMVMNKFLWFGASDDNIYYDENIRNNIIMYYRAALFPELALRLQNEGKTDKARKVLDKCFKEISAKALSYQFNDLYLAMATYEVGMEQKGDMIVKEIAQSGLRKLNWLKHLNMRQLQRATGEGLLQEALRDASESLRIALHYNRAEQVSNLKEELQNALNVIWGSNAPSVDRLLAPQDTYQEPMQNNLPSTDIEQEILE